MERTVIHRRGFEFNPDQPRDEHGRWTGEGGNDNPVSRMGTPETALNQATKAWGGNTTMVDAIQAQADQQVESGKVDTRRPAETTHENPTLNPDITGPYAGAMLRGVESGPVTTTDLSRGITVDSQNYKVGQSVQFSLGSFTEDAGHAARFADYGFDGPKMDVVFHVAAGDARSLDLQPHGFQSAQEKEHVLGGKFDVTRVYTTTATDEINNAGKVTVVNLKQTGGNFS